MNRRSVTVDGELVTIAVDDPPPVAQHWWALATASTQDEITGTPPAGALTVGIDEARIGVNYGDDGTFCLVARPWPRFPPLLALSYDLHLHVAAGGYTVLDLTATLPTHQRTIAAPAPAAGATVLTLNSTAALTAGQLLLIGPEDKPFERRRILNVGPGAAQVTLDTAIDQARLLGDPVVADEWIPVDLGVLSLRREAVTLLGRAVHRDVASQIDTPVPNATITVTDFWWTLADVQALQPGLMSQPPATRAFALSLEPGLYADRPVPGGQLAPITLATPPGNDRLLLDSVAAGDTALHLSNRQALAVGTLLRIDPDNGDAAETGSIVSIVGFGPPDQPGVATLQFPLRCDHRSGVRVVPVTPPPPAGAPLNLRRAAAPGDRCVFLDGLGALVAGSDVQVSGGALGTEYQRVAPLTAVSDAAGYFRFPAVQRIAALKLHATALGFAPVDFTFQPDYAVRENPLLVVFS